MTFRPAPDSRPPVLDDPLLRLHAVQADPTDQPPLPFGPSLPSADSSTPTRWEDDTPVFDAAEWSATLALAVFEALHGRRPVGQLTRWVDDRVQSAIAFHRRRSGSVSPGRPAVLRSVRVQYPRADAAEVCAHLGLTGRSYALALRLEVWGDRWLCVAVEF
jgi:hypothetical protein